MVKTKNKIIIEDTSVVNLKTKHNLIDTIIPDVIFHLGDIHIPGNPEREEEYEVVLNRTVDVIKKETRNKLVVICGDLFHDKTKPYQEANILARRFMKNLGDICDTIIIQGNHDVNIDNESRKDSIKATLCELETKNKIYYLTENEEYKINGINFILTKMTNEKVTSIKNKNPNELYIGLYHGTLYKSKTDDNYEFKDEGKIKASDFENYDIVMLGDIHKYQYMNKEKTIAYCGSLVQQNFGESIENHGILLWDLKNKSSKLIEVPNDYVYKTHKIENFNNIIIPNIDNKKCRLKLIYKDIEKSELRTFETKIKNKYNIITIIKNEIIDDNDTDKSSVEEEIIDRKFMDVYKDFLKINKIKEDPDVTDLLTKLLDQEQKNISKENKEIKLHELEFENLFTYGSDNKIIFDKLHGINILAGMNGLGKSSIIDIILFTIYNKFSRGSGKDALNIRHTYGYSLLRLELNGKKYTIERRIIREKTEIYFYEGYLSRDKINENINKEKQKEKDYKISNKNIKLNKSIKNIDNNSCVEKNICNDGKRNIDAQIIEMFGTYEEMIMTSIILQVGNNFIDLDDSEKREVLIKILGLNIYENVRKICSGKYTKHISIDIKRIEKDLSDIDYKDLILKGEEQINIYEAKLKKYEGDLTNILKEKYILEMNITDKNIDIDTYESEYNILLSSHRLLINNIKDFEKDINKKILKNIKKHYEELENNIIDKQNEINILIKNLKKCNMYNIDLLFEKKENLLKIIENLSNDIIEIDKSINILKRENLKILNELLIDQSEIIKKEKELILQKNIILEKIKQKESIKNIINIHKENNKDLLKHEFDDKCKCCYKNKQIHKKIGYLDKLSQLEENYLQINISDIELELIEYKLELIKNIDSNCKKIELLKLKRDSLDSKKILENNNFNQIIDDIESFEYNKQANEKINKLTIELNNYKNKLVKIKNYNEYILEKDNLLKKMNELSELINNYNKNKNNNIRLKDLLKEEQNISIIILDLKTELKKLNNNMFKDKQEYERQEKLKKDYNDELKIIKVNKSISDLYDNGFLEYVLSKRLNMLKKKMNNIISLLSNYEISIKVDKKKIIFYKIVKKDNLINKKSVKNEEIDKEINVRRLCGYERIIFNLSFRLALNNMNIMMKNNFIIIDEGFSAADSVNIHKFPLVLDTIKKEYNICILISHIDEIKNQDANIIKIKFNNKSLDSKVEII